MARYYYNRFGELEIETPEERLRRARERERLAKEKERKAKERARRARERERALQLFIPFVSAFAFWLFSKK